MDNFARFVFIEIFIVFDFVYGLWAFTERHRFCDYCFVVSVCHTLDFLSKAKAKWHGCVAEVAFIKMWFHLLVRGWFNQVIVYMSHRPNSISKAWSLATIVCDPMFTDDTNIPTGKDTSKFPNCSWLLICQPQWDGKLIWLCGRI